MKTIFLRLPGKITCSNVMKNSLRSHPRLRSRPSSQHKCGSDGFSFAGFLLVALAISVGAAAITNRSASTLLRSALQSQSREARQIALSGIDEVISELNKLENRSLLVSPRVLEWSDVPALRNPCAASGTSVTGKALEYVTNKGGSGFQVNNNPSESYTITRIQLIANNPSGPPNNRSLSVSNTPGGTLPDPNPLPPGNVNLDSADQVGYIRITVRGNLKRGDSDNDGINDVVVSTAEITKEFQVVPKCCGNSFGFSGFDSNTPPNALFEHGPDERNCLNGLDPGKYGFVVGLNGGGVNKSAGSAMNVVTDADGDPNTDGDQENIKDVVCLVDTSDTLECGGSEPTVAGGAIPVTETDINLAGDNWSIPSPPAAVSPFQESNIDSKVATDSTFLPSDGLINNYCKLENSVYKCLISDIDLTKGSPTQKTLIVDSTSAPVELYVSGDIDLGGNGTIRHVKNVSGSLVDQDLATYRDFKIIGTSCINQATCPDNQQQQIDLRGTPEGLSLFLHAPWANVSFRGDSDFLGKIWANNAELGGNNKLILPESSAESFGSGNGPLDYDWVARSTWGTRLY